MATPKKEKPIRTPRDHVRERDAKTLGKKRETGDHETASKKARAYSPAESYAVGEIVFHPKWKDEGAVVEVGKTADGHDKITVDFAELGMKRLVVKSDLKI